MQPQTASRSQAKTTAASERQLDEAGLVACLDLLHATLKDLSGGTAADPDRALEIVGEQLLRLCGHPQAVLLPQKSGPDPGDGSGDVELGADVHLVRVSRLVLLLDDCLDQLKGIPADERTVAAKQTLTTCRERLSDAIFCYELLAALPTAQLQVLPAWWPTHLPNRSRYDWMSVVRGNGDQLERNLRIFGQSLRLPASAPHAELLAGTIEKIRLFGPLKPLLDNGTLVVTEENMKLVVLDDTAFNAHIFQVCTSGLTAFGPAAFKEFAIADSAGGHTHQGVMRVRDRGTTVHTCVHESMHLLSAPAFGEAFGTFLEEGTAEYLARSICGMNLVKGGAYQANVSLLDFLLRTGRISIGTLISAYFCGQVAPIREQIVWLSGEGGLKVLRRGAGDLPGAWYAAVQAQANDDLRVKTVVLAHELSTFAGRKAAEFEVWWDTDSDDEGDCVIQ